MKEKEAENRAKYEDAAVESFVQKQTGVGMVSKNVDLPAPSVLTIKQSMDQSSNALVVSSKSSLAVTVIPTMVSQLYLISSYNFHKIFTLKYSIPHVLI